MAKKEVKEVKKVVQKKEGFTPQEFEEFDSFLKPFFEDKTWEDGKPYKLLNLMEAGVSYGAYRKTVITNPPTNWKKESYELTQYIILSIPKFQEFYDKYEKWQFYKDKQEYGERKKLEQLQKVAEQTPDAVVKEWDKEF